MKTRPASTLAGVLGALSLGLTAPLAGQLQVERVGTLGQDIPAGSPYELGIITGIAEFPDSTMWVLDPQWPKIVGFDASGRPAHLIPLSRGEGPGEVMNPIDVVAVGEQLAVLDHQLGRVTFFTRAGEVARVVRLESGAGWRLAVTSDRIWTTKPDSPRRDVGRIVFEHDLDGALLGTRESRHPEDRKHLLGLDLAVREDRVFSAVGNPGAVWVHDRSGSRRVGTVAFEDLFPWYDEALRRDPIQVGNMAVLSNGDILQHWVQTGAVGEPVESLEEMRQGLLLLGPDGATKARAVLPAGEPLSPKYSFVSALTGDLLIPDNELFPHIVRYRVVR